MRGCSTVRRVRLESHADEDALCRFTGGVADIETHIDWTAARNTDGCSVVGMAHVEGVTRDDPQVAVGIAVAVLPGDGHAWNIVGSHGHREINAAVVLLPIYGNQKAGALLLRPVGIQCSHCHGWGLGGRCCPLRGWHSG